MFGSDSPNMEAVKGVTGMLAVMKMKLDARAQSVTVTSACGIVDFTTEHPPTHTHKHTHRRAEREAAQSCAMVSIWMRRTR